jgi:hypothetical protein
MAGRCTAGAACFFLACVIFATADHDMKIRVSIPRSGAVVGGSIRAYPVNTDTH